MSAREKFIEEAWEAYYKVHKGPDGHQFRFMDRGTFIEAVRAIDTARRYDLEIKEREEKQ